MAASYKYKNIRKGEEQLIAVFDVFNDGTFYVDEMSLDMVEDEYDILNAAFKAAAEGKEKEILRKKRTHFSNAKFALLQAGAKRTTSKEVGDTSSTSVEGAVKKAEEVMATCLKDPTSPKVDGTLEQTRSQLVSKGFSKLMMGIR